MKLLVDADLPAALTQALRAQRHDVLDVRELQPPVMPDQAVYQRAVTDQRILLTRDLDFSNVLTFRPKAPVGIVVLRVRALSPPEVVALVEDAFHRLSEPQWQGAITIIQPGRYRRRVIS